MHLKPPLQHSSTLNIQFHHEVPSSGPVNLNKKLRIEDARLSRRVQEAERQAKDSDAVHGNLVTAYSRLFAKW